MVAAHAKHAACKEIGSIWLDIQALFADFVGQNRKSCSLKVNVARVISVQLIRSAQLLERILKLVQERDLSMVLSCVRSRRLRECMVCWKSSSILHLKRLFVCQVLLVTTLFVCLKAAWIMLFSECTLLLVAIRLVRLFYTAM